jgi:hypothetical protein
MSVKVFHPCKLSLFAALSVVDFSLTYYLVQRSGGRVYESNPIAHAWFSDYGWPGLLFFKVVVVLLVGAVCVYISLHRPRLAGSILMFACVAVAAVVVYSCSLAAGFIEGHPAPAKSLAKVGHGRHHGAVRWHEDPRLTLTQELAGEVATGTCLLSDAVERLASSKGAMDPEWLSWLREPFVGELNDREVLAAQLLYRAVRIVQGKIDKDLAECADAQLKAEFWELYQKPCPARRFEGHVLRHLAE